MANPYKDLPESAFWKRTVAAAAGPADLDPVGVPPFGLCPDDRIATAGSCFAQHISRTLKERGFRYLETESGEEERGFGIFSARFGNIYTARQLLQLFQRAYGLFEPKDSVWRLPDDRLVDPFRPRVEPGGFDTAKALLADRDAHLAAVREMFESCDVFVFTLGLTEGWRSRLDGAVVPLAPGVAGSPEDDSGSYEFHNFTVKEMVEDLSRFIRQLRTINPSVRLIFTVSPVPLVATYEPQHILLSTIYSKAALRVAADEIVRATENAAYFPSFEIITGHHTGYRYFSADRRTVTNEGVDRAMALFSLHYLTDQRPLPKPATLPRVTNEFDLPDDLHKIVCDEEALAQ